MAAALVVLGALLLAGIVLIWRFVAAEEARDLAAWQQRLGLIADGRAAAIDDWVERQIASVRAVAENTSVQLYMSELAASGGDAAQVTDEPAQISYLRNLLVVSAQNGGFAAPAVGPAVNANVRRLGVAGMALVDAKKRPLVGTPQMPPLEGKLGDFVAAAKPGEAALLDLYPGSDGAPAMAFLAPVLAIEGGDPSQQVGFVLAVKPVGEELFPLLRRPGPPEPGAEAMLVRAVGDIIEYLSPLADGTPPLKRRLARSAPDLAEAFAVAEPGAVAVRRDYRGEPVLATGRALPPTSWTLVYEVERAVALGESDRRGQRLALVFGLALAVALGVVVAVWYAASSRRATQSASAFRTLAARFASQGALLRLVTDSQPNAIFIADGDGRYRFANRETARRLGVGEDDLLGKTLDQVLGPAAAARTRDVNKAALDEDRTVMLVDRTGPPKAARIVQSTHVPLPAGPDLPRSVLVVEEDVTDLTRERERRERVLRQLVGAMTAAVDRRDRFAADQSTRVAMLARAIADEMGLDPVLAETAEIAGNLLNFGKLLVPPDLLTKREQLSEAERTQIRASIQATADIIAEVEFPGPVVATLRAVHERWDGGGPQSLKSDAIPVTARIVAVANAFVAMASPRAYRAGADVDGAVTALLARAGSEFDRSAVAAVITWLDVRGGRARWTALAERTPASGDAGAA